MQRKLYRNEKPNRDMDAPLRSSRRVRPCQGWRRTTPNTKRLGVFRFEDQQKKRFETKIGVQKSSSKTPTVWDSRSAAVIWVAMRQDDVLIGNDARADGTAVVHVVAAQDVDNLIARAPFELAKSNDHPVRNSMQNTTQLSRI